MQRKFSELSCTVKNGEVSGYNGELFDHVTPPFTYYRPDRFTYRENAIVCRINT